MNSKLFNPRSLVGQSFAVMILKGAGMLLGYIASVFISRKYGPEGIGIYSISYTTVIILSYIASLGLPEAILRYMGQFGDKLNSGKRVKLYYKSLKIVFISSVFISCTLFCFSERLSIILFSNLAFSEVILWIAVITPFFTLNLINVESLRGIGLPAASEFYRSCLITTGTLLLLFMAKNSSLMFPVSALLLSVLITAAGSTGNAILKIRKLERIKTSSISLKELFSTSTPLMIVSLGSYFLGNISVYVIQVFEDTSQVGIYSLSLKLSLLISFVLIAVNTVIAPKISKLFWSGQMQNLADVVKKATKYIFLLSLPPFLFLTFFPETTLGFIGSGFKSGKYTLMILSLGQLLNVISGPVGLVLSMSGNQKSVMMVSLYVLVFTLALNVVFVFHFGILGAAIAMLMSIALKSLWLLRITKKKLGLVPIYFPSKYR